MHATINETNMVCALTKNINTYHLPLFEMVQFANNE